MRLILCLAFISLTATSAYATCDAFPVTGDICSGRVYTWTESPPPFSTRKYQLYRNGAPYLDLKTGTGSQIFWTVSLPGNYQVLCISPCNVWMQGQFSMPEAGPGVNACVGGQGTLGVSFTNANSFYELVGSISGSLGTKMSTANGSFIPFDYTSAGPETFQLIANGCQIGSPINAGASFPPASTAVINNCLPGIVVTNNNGNFNYNVLVNNAIVASSSGTGSVPIVATGSGAFKIETSTNQSGCITTTNIGTATISYATVPVVYDVSLSSGSIYACDGPLTKKIKLSGSEVGTSYQLKDNNTNIQSLPGTGGALEWTVSAIAGAYYHVVATKASSGCVLDMNGFVVIESAQAPAVLSLNSDICSGTITISCPEVDAEYQLYANSVPVQPPQRILAGCNGTVQWTGLAAANYTVRSTSVTTQCYSWMGNAVNIPVNAVPSSFTLSGGGTGCSTSVFAITLNGSQTGVDYTLNDNYGAAIQTISGTNSPLTWTLTSQLSTKTFTVTAKNTTTLCVKPMNGSATITYNGPNSYPLSPNVCASTLSLDCSETGVTYQLWLNNGPVASSEKAGLGSCTTPLQWTMPAPGIYKVKATRADGCWTWTNDYILQPNSIVQPFNIDYGSVCNGGSRTVRVIGGQSQTTYRLLTPSGEQKGIASGPYPEFNVSLGLFPPTSQTFYVRGTSDISGCSTNSSQFTLTPYSPVVSGGGVFCTSTTLTVNPGTNVFYQWYKNNVIINGATGTSLLVNTVGTNDVYKVSVSAAGMSCSSQATVTIGVYNVTPAISQASSCTGTVTLTGNISGTGYLWSTGATTASIQVTTPGTYTLKVKSSEGCWSNTGSTTVSSTSAPNFSLSTSGTICQNGQVTISAVNIVGSVQSVSWSPVSGSSTSITVYNANTYTCTITFAGGCQVSRSVVVKRTPANCPIPLMAAEEPTFTETSFYPNPADHEITLTTPAVAYERKISIINMQGIVRQNAVLPSNESTKRIPLGDMSDGIYLLVLESSHKTERFKVLINQKR